MKTIAAPVLSGDRITILDTVRGFALFGILVANMQFFLSANAECNAGVSGNRIGTGQILHLAYKISFRRKVLCDLFGAFWIRFCNYPFKALNRRE